ncbi:unnamed protein product [Paramecium sonneborni]|uniref:Uncharacterized protein n=1 Tax=Paramecium sonneborni TaxID=65129 RepID=A0A8S1RNJ0_9CILI|nr:unnamed protein product [Paramecium sonneborni]
MKGIKVDRWDILWNYNKQNQQIGGGQYEGQKKLGDGYNLGLNNNKDVIVSAVVLLNQKSIILQIFVFDSLQIQLIAFIDWSVLNKESQNDELITIQSIKFEKRSHRQLRA